MKKHCVATCLTGVVLYAGVVSPIIGCFEHNHYHIHYDEPAVKLLTVQGSNSFEPLASVTEPEVSGTNS